ncbi:MAG: hypothetical protein IH627_21750 [Rubrivivax sp.]|nr:hypothetical protein [Rubrivivax sp.]
MRTLTKFAARAALALSVLTLTPVAWAADVKMIAKVAAVTVAADGGSAVVTLINAKDGAEVKVTVSDKTTLDKLASKGIAPGDQVRVSYDNAGARNMSKTLKKAEGC